MPKVNKDEQNAYMKEWRDKNREKVREYYRQFYAEKMADPEYAKKCYDRKNTKRLERQNIIKTTVMAEFQKNGCYLCSEKEKVCLVAHHLAPNLKEFNIGKAIAQSYTDSLEKITEELKKCVCVCHNCHYKVHVGLLTVSSPLQFC